jgi:ABC-2 type transport system permease protein
MISDLRTVVWKEWREFREQLLSIRRGGISALVLALVLGVVTPAQMGEGWLESSLLLAYWPFVASSMVSSLIADSIAGERERHTLETLLASRLSDTAILLGKVIAAVTYGVGFAVANLTLGWLSVNLFHYEGTLMWFESRYLAMVLGLTFVTALAVSGVGVFISLRAATVKQAQQTFGVAMVIAIMAPVLIFQGLSEHTRLRLLGRVTEVGRERIVLAIAAILTAIAVLVFIGAVARFRRGRLVFD